MKDLNAYTEEVHRRVEVRSRTLAQQRRRTLAICLPLAACVALGALFLPAALRRDRQVQPDGAGQNQISGGTSVLTGNALPGVPAGSTDTEYQQEPEMPEWKPTDTPGAIRQIGTDGVPVDSVGAPVMEAAQSMEPLPMPADFSFRFVWGPYGISSYDSQTGTLVKTTDATHPEDYRTELRLTEEQLQTAWSWLSGLKLETYPSEYDPYNDPASEVRVASEPSRDLVLTLRTGGEEITVRCPGICCISGPGLTGYDQRAEAFLEVCDRLTQLLVQTPAWQSLPDYEFFYE